MTSKQIQRWKLDSGASPSTQYSQSIQNESKEEDDGIHKWLVLVSAYVTTALNVGLCLSIGSLFHAIMEEFGTTRAETAVMQSTLYAVFLGSGIIAGPLVRRYGTQRAGFVGSMSSSVGIMASYFASSITFLVVSLGIVSGLGFSLMYISANAATDKHFSGERKLLFLSILVSGSGVGGMFYPYMMAYLNDVYGLNGTLLLVGIMCGHSIPSSLLWTNRDTSGKSNANVDNNVDEDYNVAECNTYSNDAVTTDSRKNSETIIDSMSLGRLSNSRTNASLDGFADFGRPVCIAERQVDCNCVDIISNMFSFLKDAKGMGNTDKNPTVCGGFINLIKNKTFVCFMIASTIPMPALVITLIFITDIFADKGYTEADANLGLLLINAIGIFGRLCPGFIVQLHKFPTIGVPIIASLVGALSTLGVTTLPTIGASLFSCALLGFSQGMFVAMLTVMPVRLVEQRDLPTAMGLLFTSNGIGNAVIGPVSGFIRDRTNSYNVALYSAAGCLVFAAVIFIIAHVMRRKAKKEKPRTDIEQRYVFSVTKF